MTQGSDSAQTVRELTSGISVSARHPDGRSPGPNAWYAPNRLLVFRPACVHSLPLCQCRAFNAACDRFPPRSSARPAPQLQGAAEVFPHDGRGSPGLPHTVAGTLITFLDFSLGLVSIHSVGTAADQLEITDSVRLQLWTLLCEILAARRPQTPPGQRRPLPPPVERARLPRESSRAWPPATCARACARRRMREAGSKRGLAG